MVVCLFTYDDNDDGDDYDDGDTCHGHGRGGPTVLTVWLEVITELPFHCRLSSLSFSAAGTW